MWDWSCRTSITVLGAELRLTVAAPLSLERKPFKKHSRVLSKSSAALQFPCSFSEEPESSPESGSFTACWWRWCLSFQQVLRQGTFPTCFLPSLCLAFSLNFTSWSLMPEDPAYMVGKPAIKITEIFGIFCGKMLGSRAATPGLLCLCCCYWDATYLFLIFPLLYQLRIPCVCVCLMHPAWWAGRWLRWEDPEVCSHAASFSCKGEH